MKRDSRTAWLAGPFPSHELAQALTPLVRALAGKYDAFTHFDAFGTASITSDKPLEPGVLNAHEPLLKYIVETAK
jgi:hypothetical protein